MAREQVNVGLLGCGTVGSGFARMAVANAEKIRRRLGAALNIARVAVLDPEKEAIAELPRGIFCADAMALVTDPEIDIIVECIGGVGAAKDLVFAAVERGKSVVTANKELLAKYGHELLALAREKGVDVNFEASVASAIPLIRPMKESIEADNVNSILAILNGTTNYILMRMAKDHLPFDQALAEAQEQGYAEQDPSDDIDGHDAAYKLAIIASIAWEQSVDIDQVVREGIREIEPRDHEAAQECGYVIKLLAIAKQAPDGRLEIRVHPALVPEDHPLASVAGAYNAVFLSCEYAGNLMFYGPGAGSFPAGSAILGDVIDAARNILRGAAGRVPCTCAARAELVPPSEFESGHYVRAMVVDEPGVLGSIATIFGQHRVSIAAVHQQEAENGEAEIIWITHTCKQEAFDKALAGIKALPCVNKICASIRVEHSIKRT